MWEPSGGTFNYILEKGNIAFLELGNLAEFMFKAKSSAFSLTFIYWHQQNTDYIKVGKPGNVHPCTV